MHELTLAKHILDIILEKAREQSLSVVRTIYLEIGQLAAVDTAALSFTFEVASRATLAEHAQLLIENIPGRAQCDHCQKTVTITRYGEACTCGSFSLTLLTGDDLRVKSMEGI